MHGSRASRLPAYARTTRQLLRLQRWFAAEENCRVHPGFLVQQRTQKAVQVYAAVISESQLLFASLLSLARCVCGALGSQRRRRSKCVNQVRPAPAAAVQIDTAHRAACPQLSLAACGACQLQERSSPCPARQCCASKWHRVCLSGSWTLAAPCLWQPLPGPLGGRVREAEQG